MFGVISSGKDTLNFSVLEFIYVAVMGKDMYGGYCCTSILNSELVLGGNLEIFSTCFQGLPAPLK